MEFAEQMQAIITKYRLGDASGVEEGLAKVDAELARLREANAKIDELTPQAADGRTYRADLIAETMAEGVRAYGQSFDKATYEGMLATAPIATIKRMRDDWKKTGDERLPAGRATTDNGEEPPAKQAKVSHVPDAAYRG